jgi:hypothetical protein
MKTSPISSARRPILAGVLVLVAAVAALAAWAQNDSGLPTFNKQDMSFGHINSVGVESPPQVNTTGVATSTAPNSGLKQVELAATSLQIVSLGGGVAFWDPVKRMLYVYPGDFSTCTGIYQMGKAGDPMTRVGP